MATAAAGAGAGARALPAAHRAAMPPVLPEPHGGRNADR
eukprot:CAMPEP_0118865196 /NCGR_PEP_ID=MMETSP1163-20130328/9522_1 /TAXON_ID=124430 /ORGANISM="Phaeomonas parva, Strain CCMP2877" /LENGTH=38 /DNA_ID= /DNA_START= /DNA_END= /DNA_ORIENTATION=